jgi:adenylylsulfate kinase
MSGVVVWITGLPSSGKSTLARRVLERLPGAVLLDGDEVRAAIAPDLGYSPEDRETFYGALARLASMLAVQGHAVIVAATAQRRAWRDLARARAPRFVEFFVDVPLAECARRDAKGLYAAGAPALPGVGTAYEPPSSPDVRAAGGRDEAAAARIVELTAPSP